MANINQPIRSLWERHNFGEVKRNFLKDALTENGYWERQPEKLKEIINNLPKI